MLRTFLRQRENSLNRNPPLCLVVVTLVILGSNLHGNMAYKIQDKTKLNTKVIIDLYY